MQFSRTRLAGAFLALALSPFAQAGFLEMPDTTEVPEMERESLLKDLDIPPVSERDPDPNAGPRLNVTQFRVQGIVEYPELGITRKSLNDLVESIRFEMMGEGELLESGFTVDELGEVSDLIAEIESETEGEHVGPEEVQRLVFLIREQRRERGVTLGMIETVADTITRYYRERGFILAKAYIPQQRVRDGIVNLTLLLGNLGEVEVHNNDKYRASTLENIFEPVVGDPITASGIETRLFYINDLPGMSAQAFFEPGSQVGDTKLNINVVEEESFNGNVRIDNHGSESTGKYRLYLDGYWHNPGRFGDQLHVGLLGTFEPSDSLYGSLHYRVPVFSPRWSFSVGGSTNDFLTNISGIEVTGESRVLDAALTHLITRSRVKNYSAELRFAEIDTDIEDETGALDQMLDTVVRNLDLALSFDVLQEQARALHQGSVRLTYGDLVERDANVAARSTQDENPLILGLNYSLLKFLPVPLTDAQSRVVVKTAAQYTEKSVPSVNQMSLAGPNRMRGFAINLFNADRGIYLGSDWIFSAPAFLSTSIGGQPLSELLQPYVFADIAYGHSEGAARAQPPQRVTMADAGIGLRFSFKGFRTSLTYAKALHYESDVGPRPEEMTDLDDLEEDGQVYFDLLYSF